jgi:hypothetical protein
MRKHSSFTSLSFRISSCFCLVSDSSCTVVSSNSTVYACNFASATKMSVICNFSGMIRFVSKMIFLTCKNRFGYIRDEQSALKVYARPGINKLYMGSLQKALPALSTRTKTMPHHRESFQDGLRSTSSAPRVEKNFNIVINRIGIVEGASAFIPILSKSLALILYSLIQQLCRNALSSALPDFTYSPVKLSKSLDL